MTDKPAVPTEPADDDVRIFEHCEVHGVVTGWEVSAREGFLMKRYDTEKEACKAARMFAQLHKRDVWGTRTGVSTQLTELVERHRPPTYYRKVFDPLRADPRFQPLLRRMNFLVQA